MNPNIKSCVVLAPHTDDGEFGCGGLIARLIENKVDVHYIAFSICEDSVPEGYPKDTLLKEVTQATQSLAIHSANLHVLKHKVRYFLNARQDILQFMYDFNKKHSPDLVLCPASDDIHQDHHVIFEEAVRAFKKSTILGYELPWNNQHFKHDLFVQISEGQLNKKFKAIQCYESQVKKGRNYMDESFIRGMAKMRGVQSGYDAAEAFEIIRMHWKL